MVKSLPESAQIKSVLQNRTLSTNLYDPIYSEGVKVFVLSTDLKRAQDIVNDYRNSKVL